MARLGSTIIERPVYGEPEKPVFGQVMGMLAVNSRQQLRVLSRVLESGMREFAGRHEETLLAKLHRDLADMDRRATAENWTGWNSPAAALTEGEQK